MCAIFIHMVYLLPGAGGGTMFKSFMDVSELRLKWEVKEVVIQTVMGFTFYLK